MVGSPFSPVSLYNDSELAVIEVLLGRLNVDSLFDAFLSGTLVGVSLVSITVLVVFLILRDVDDELLLSLLSVVFDDSSLCFLCEKSLEKALPRLSLF